MDYFGKHPGCAVLGCRLRYPDGSFQPSGGELPGPGNVGTWLLGIELIPATYYLLSPIHPKNISYFSRDREVGWVMGAFMMLKREVYEKTGGFDENFFMYTEEVEWCRRIKNSGYKIFYTPSFSVVHVGKASSKFVETTPLVREMTGMKLFFKKTLPEIFGTLKFTYLVLKSLEAFGIFPFGKER